MDIYKNPNQDLEASDVLRKLQNHKKILIGWSIAVIVLAIVALVWYFIAMNGARKADEAVALADIEMNDSTALAYYMDASKMGYKSGNRAALNAAIQLYKNGEYEQAIKYLKDASISSPIIEAGQYSLLGDCYVNLQQYDQAITAYNKALSVAKGNTQICPFILVKEANVYRETGRFDDEYKAYKQIIDNYPGYVQSLKQRNIDLRKYTERAKAETSK